MELSLSRTFIPGSKVQRNFCFQERKWRGTLAPRSENVMDLSLPGAKMSWNFCSQLPKNVTLAFIYNNKTGLLYRLYRGSRLWRPRSTSVHSGFRGSTVARCRCRIPGRHKGGTFHVIRQFGAKCMKWDFKGITWWNGACTNSFVIFTHRSPELAVLDNWMKITN